MTREEAWNRIDAIIEKHEVDDMYVTITNVSDYDALRFARKTLEATCDDCISRKDAIERFVHWWSEMLENHKEGETFDNILKTLPSVNAQPQKGYWINLCDAMEVFEDFMCDEVDEEGLEILYKMLLDKAILTK